MPSLKQLAEYQRVIIAAHRGSSGTSVENSAAALTEALDAGADMVEIDVRLSKDGVPFLYHDARIQDSTGLTHDVSGFEFREFRKRVRSGDLRPGKGASDVLSLAEALVLVGTRACISLEMKSILGADIDREALATIIECVRALEINDSVLFTSFDERILMTIAHLYPDTYRGVIQIPGDSRMPSEICHRVGAHAYICNVSHVSAGMMLNAAEHKIPVGVYTINAESDFVYAISMGVKAVATNFPRTAIRWREEVVTKGRR